MRLPQSKAIVFGIRVFIHDFSMMSKFKASMNQLPRLSGNCPPNNLSTRTFSKLRELIKELRYTPRSSQGVKTSAV